MRADDDGNVLDQDTLRTLISYCNDCIHPQFTPESHQLFDDKFHILFNTAASSINESMNQHHYKLYYTLFNLCIGYARYEFNHIITNEAVMNIYEIYNLLCSTTDTTNDASLYGSTYKCAPSRQPRELIKQLTEKSNRGDNEWNNKVWLLFC